MTLTELRYIVAVARERHFGRAAETCCVSQPTLSVGVRKLEEELGIRLFERGHNDVSPTLLGEQVVAQAQRVLEAAEGVKRIAKRGADPLSEPLRIGLIHTIGPYLLPHLIPVLREQAPQMPILVEEGYTADLRLKLKRGALDLIVISYPFAESGVETLPLYDEPFVVLLPAGHPWNQRSEIPAQDLASETVLLLGEGHCFRDQVLEACPGCLRSAADGGLQQTLVGSSLETIRHMVASGIGITVLPCSSAGADEYSRRLVTIRRFAGRTPRRRVALAWRKGFLRPRAIEVLHDAINRCPLSCLRLLNRDAAVGNITARD